MGEDNYIIVPVKYAKAYDLKGNELLVFSLILGFSQDGKSVFQGSTSYIADCLNITKRSVIGILNNLVKGGYIEKIEKEVNGSKLCDYRAQLISGGGENFSPPMKILHGGGENFSPHNTIDNIIYTHSKGARTREEEFALQFLSEANRAKLEKLCMDNHTDMQTIENIVTETVNEWQLAHQTHKDYSDAAGHLISIIKIRLKDERNRTCNSGSGNPEREERRRDIMQRIARMQENGE